MAGFPPHSSADMLPAVGAIGKRGLCGWHDR